MSLFHFILTHGAINFHYKTYIIKVAEIIVSWEIWDQNILCVNIKEKLPKLRLLSFHFV